MAVDLCLEATAGVLHALEMTWIELFWPGRSSDRPATSAPQMLELDAGRIVADATFNQLVAQSADALPFDEAQTLWLVDVCGLSYAEAADQMATTHTEVTFLVRQARGRVRTDLLSNPSVG